MSHELNLSSAFTVVAYVSVHHDGTKVIDPPYEAVLDSVSSADNLPFGIENELKEFQGGQNVPIEIASAGRKTPDITFEFGNINTDLLAVLKGSIKTAGATGIDTQVYKIPEYNFEDFRVRKTIMIDFSNSSSTRSVKINGAAASITANAAAILNAGQVYSDGNVFLFSSKDRLKKFEIGATSNGIDFVASGTINNNLKFAFNLFQSIRATAVTKDADSSGAGGVKLTSIPYYDFSKNAVPDIGEVGINAYGLVVFNPEFSIATGKFLSVKAYYALVGMVSLTVSASEMPAAGFYYYIVNGNGFKRIDSVLLRSDYVTTVSPAVSGWVVAEKALLNATTVLIKANSGATGTVQNGNKISFDTQNTNYLVTRTVSNGSGYQVKGAVTKGKAVVIDTGTGNFNAGDKVSFDGGATDFTVSAALSGVGTLKLVQEISDTIADNATVTIVGRVVTLDVGLHKEVNAAAVVTVGSLPVQTISVGDNLSIVNDAPNTGSVQVSGNYAVFNSADEFDVVRFFYIADTYSFSPLPQDKVFSCAKVCFDESKNTMRQVPYALPLMLGGGEIAVDSSGTYYFSGENVGLAVQTNTQYTTLKGYTINDYSAPAGKTARATVVLVADLADEISIVYEIPDVAIKLLSIAAGQRDFKPGKLVVNAVGKQVLDENTGKFKYRIGSWSVIDNANI